MSESCTSSTGFRVYLLSDFRVYLLLDLILKQNCLVPTFRFFLLQEVTIENTFENLRLSAVCVCKSGPLTQPPPPFQNLKKSKKNLLPTSPLPSVSILVFFFPPYICLRILLSICSHQQCVYIFSIFIFLDFGL
jgi:hypothetical protein